MRLAYLKQNLQDWVTQQWVILRGSKIDPDAFPWLAGPFGELKGTGADFINQLAEKENLIIERETKSRGLLASIKELHLPQEALSGLSPEVIRFYENTASYELNFQVKWNPLFKVFGLLVNKLFSRRINQLNIPIQNPKEGEVLKSEIVTLSDPQTGKVKYTIWLRTFEASGQIVYSGAYGTCKLPSGEMCVKAVFPLPKGNATVIMRPEVGRDGSLILDSSGKRLGDAGFYFQLQDTKGGRWVQFIRSFRDKLVVGSENNLILAEQTLSLWGLRVLRFTYRITLKT